MDISKITDHPEKQFLKRSGAMPATKNSSFSSEIIKERADQLLKSTGQYDRWVQLRQNNDKDAGIVAQLVVDRHKAVTKWQQQGSIDTAKFNTLTTQIRQYGIDLYTSEDLQKYVTSNKNHFANPQKALQSQSPQTTGRNNHSTPPSLVKADRLLKNTNQNTKWENIRQNNDNKAKRLANILVKRHSILQEARKNNNVDVQLFDKLTKQLGQAGVHLYHFNELNLGKITESIPESLPLPVTTPVTPYIPSATTYKGTEPLSPKTAQPVPAVALNETSRLTTEIPAQQMHIHTDSPLNDENLLILDLQSKELALNQTVFTYGDDRSILVPLDRFARALDFNIEVNPEDGSAHGWFIDEQRVFSLNTQQKHITVDGMTIPWKEGDVVVGEDEIYIDSKAFASWFPVDFDLSLSELTLTLTPREKLPYQLRMDRENQRLGYSGREEIPLKYPIQEIKYDLYSLPVVDVTLHGGHGSKTLETSDLQGEYSLLARGDLAYMNSYLYASGIEDSPLDTARIRLDRVDPQANLLGPLHANRVIIGDILPATFPVLPSNSPERGIFLSNTELNRSTSYDSTRFEGTLTPGWEVEVYQNGVFIQRQVVGANGRYLFDDVPVYYGNNTFEVIGFGPQGQKQLLEEQKLKIGTGMLPQGDGIYQFSTSQFKQTVLGIDEDDSPIDNDQPRITGVYQYGLTDNISAEVGISSVEFEQERHNYLQTGISGSALSSYGEIDLIKDTASGTGVSLSAQTSLSNININAEQSFFSDFIMESRPNATLESKSELQLNGTILKSTITPSLSYTLSSQYLKYSDDESASLTARLSGRLSDVYLSNNTSWNYHKKFQKNKDIDGLFQASGDIGPVRVTGDLKYNLDNDSPITHVGISGDWQWDQNLRAGVELMHEPVYNDKSTAIAKLDWDTGPAFISPSVSYDTDGNVGAYLTLSFSLGRNPNTEQWKMSSDHSADKGNISSFVYQDNNNNQQFDVGDIPLPKVKVQAIQSWGETVTDNDGHALISGLQSYKATDVELDIDTLEDPFAMPSTKGIAVQPRPGHFDHVEFPIVTTGEIDGTLYLLGANGVNEGRPGMKLELLGDENNVLQEVYTEFDGFYLFEKVLPGKYTVRVSPGNMEQGFTAQEHEVTIGNDGTIASGKDIILRNQELSLKKTGPLAQNIEREPITPIRLSAKPTKKFQTSFSKTAIPVTESSKKPDDRTVDTQNIEKDSIDNTSNVAKTAEQTKRILDEFSFSDTELKEKQVPAMNTNPQFIPKPMLPVVEYTHSTVEINTNRVKRRNNQQVEQSFNAIQPPISRFSPIDESTLKATRTIRSTPLPAPSSPLFTYSPTTKQRTNQISASRAYALAARM